MRNIKQFAVLFLSVALVLSLSAQTGTASFQWPDSKRAALSLSFDDARLSNVDVGTPLFRQYGVKVTFYVVPSRVKERHEQWKQAVAEGHEIGNHILVHPCSGNFDWSRHKALEYYSLASMRQELVDANQQIEMLLGVRPSSFAYSCGQTYVGRGQKTESYVPLVAEVFTSGRGWLDESPNDPVFTDLAQLQGVEMDGKDFEQDIKPILENALETGSWIVLAGHEIGEGGRQTTRTAMLKALIEYVQAPDSKIWMAPVGTVADHVNRQRGEIRSKLRDALTFCSTFDQGYDADLSKGDSQIYTAPADEQSDIAMAGMHNEKIKIAQDRGLNGHALAFTEKAKPAIYFQAAQNIAYHDEEWNGTISLWLSLDPEQDLEPGYTDPIQITDVAYNDAALWVDFSDKNPRDFRMGVYGDLEVWNPDNIGPDKFPGFAKRLLPAKYRPFGTGLWTHVAVTFSGLNSGEGTASFYINGRHQGTRTIPEPFTWELDQAKIFLGLNYVGLMDEVALFDRSLSAEEVDVLYRWPGGISTLLD